MRQKGWKHAASFLQGMSRSCSHLHVSLHNDDDAAPLFQVLDDPAEDHLHMGTHAILFFFLVVNVSLPHSPPPLPRSLQQLRTYAADFVHPTFMLQFAPRYPLRSPGLPGVAQKCSRSPWRRPLAGRRPTLLFCGTLKPKYQTLRDRTFLAAAPHFPLELTPLHIHDCSDHFSFKNLIKTHLLKNTF